MVRTLVARLLESNGYAVHEAANSEEALRILADGGDSFELMITDMVMPGMNGVELVQHLARHYPRVKVLCVSGHLDLKQRHELSSDYELLQKPFTEETLMRKVSEVLHPT